MKNFGLKFVLVLSVATISALANAMPITGVTVTTSYSSPSPFGSVIESIVDGSGLSSYTTGAIHEVPSSSNSWATAGFPGGFFTFDLGDVYNVDGMAVWNFTSIGFNAVTIRSSIDFGSFSSIPGAPTNFAIGVAGPAPAEIFNFTTTARYISIKVTSIHGSTLPALGLSEVMFTGTKPSEAPVPATLALLGVGLSGLAWSRRKKT
ncbi:MAG: PEP-CTERM sorting domain-containing protein [Haliea sp.]|nr:PEP-CTERM sorting domain-containing protein [Haliea sp.]